MHGVGAATTVNSGGTLQLSGTGGDQIYSGVTVTVNSGGVFDANGLSEGLTSLALNGTGISGSGALVNSAASTTSTLTCTFPLGADTSIGGAGNLTLTGVMSGAHALTYLGNGILTLSSANTFTLGLTINAGSTVLLNAAAGAGTGTVTINGNGILKLNAAVVFANTITGGATSVITVSTASGNTSMTGDLSTFKIGRASCRERV